MIYDDRLDAAMHLIPLLEPYRDAEGIVLAIPRGGVPVAYYIAKEFHFPMDLLLTKKIGHPSSAELAIGAVSLENEVIDPRHHVSEAYLKEQIKIIRHALKERYIKFMGHRSPVDVKGLTVIIVDDGIATGNTILAAIRMIRAKHPKQIVVAVPVAPYRTAMKLKEEVDDFICPHIPETFFGVGEFYRDFSQVSDEEVISYLQDHNHHAALEG